MQKLKLGVDIDGVLVHTDERAYLRFCEEHLGWSINYEIFEKTHSWRDATGQQDEKALMEAFQGFLDTAEGAQKPIAGACDALRAISMVADIYFITARGIDLKAVTAEFIANHVFDIQDQQLSMGNLENKAKPIREYGVDYYIDDSFRELSLIIKNQAINTTIIPFPSAHSLMKKDNIQDPRLHWVAAWEDVHAAASPSDHAGIWQRAWEEISHIITRTRAGAVQVI
jgi:uncharacterized HAD superfamily protein